MIYSLAQINDLYDQANYAGVVNFTNSINSDDPDFFSKGKYRLSALIKLERLTDAYELLCNLKSINSSDRWLIFLNFDYLHSNGNSEDALNLMLDFVDSNLNDYEAVNLLLKVASWLARFDVIQKYSRYRFEKYQCDYLISNSSITIVLQVYVKTDTLRELFEDLLKARLVGNYKLLIIKDHPKSNDLLDKSRAVDDLIYEFYKNLQAKFSEVRFVVNKENKGTSPTCLLGINLACRDSETSHVIFLEDDCRLSVNVFEWFNYAFANLLSDSHPFVGGESVHFNDLSSVVGGSLMHKIVNSPKIPDYEDKYLEVDFVPSTCFAFEAKRWSEFYLFRGMPEGPETLNTYVKSHSYKCNLPVIPRVNDHGMMHEDGYSMLTLDGDVKEIKRPYIISSAKVAEFSPLLVDKDNFFKATCMFDKDFVDLFF